jgi:hypothetical protein
MYPSSSIGCPLGISSLIVHLNHGETIAIDWDEDFFRQHIKFSDMTVRKGGLSNAQYVEYRILQRVDDHESFRAASSIKSHVATFSDCMALFTAEERLEGDSRFFDFS